MDFLDIIKKQRVDSQKEAWRGSFIEYLEVLQKNPETVKLAAKRLVDSVESYGVERLEDSDPR